jgi:hypothetical protein
VSSYPLNGRTISPHPMHSFQARIGNMDGDVMAFSLRTTIQKGYSVFNTSRYPRWVLESRHTPTLGTRDLQEGQPLPAQATAFKPRTRCKLQYTRLSITSQLGLAARLEQEESRVKMVDVGSTHCRHSAVPHRIRGHDLACAAV